MKPKPNILMPSNSCPPITRRHCRHVVATLLISCGSMASAADLLKWDITGTTGTTSGSAASQVSPGVNGSIMTVGGAAGSTSPGGTWNRTFDPAADPAAAQTAGNYFSFTTSADPGFTVSISGISAIGFRRTTAIGATDVALYYSYDNSSFTQTGTTFPVTTTNDSAAANFSSTMSGTPIVMTGGQTIYWRVVVFGNTASGRLGMNNGGSEDVVFTGTSVPDVAIRNLLWTGTGGSDWNTTTSNTNWADTGNANAATYFATNDNVTINSAATIAVDAGGVSPGNVTVNATTGTVSLAGGGINGLGLSKSGGSTLAIAGTNSFSGGVSLDGGILVPASSGSLGTGGIAINGGTLNTPGTVTAMSNNVSLGTAGGTLNTDADVTFSGTFSATGAAVEASNQLTKTGPGVLTLNKTGNIAFGAQSNSGAIGTSIELDIAAGGVVFSGNGSRYLGGTCTWNAPVTLAGGTVMLHGNTVDGTGTITVKSASTIVTRLNRGACTVANPITLDTGALTLESPVNILLNVNGSIGGGNNLVKEGNGVVLLAADNTYGGTTTVQAGTLRVGGSPTAATGSVGAGAIALTTAASTIEFSRNNALVVPGAISGLGNVVVVNGASGSTSLAGASDYTGTTSLSGGTLVASVLADGGFPSSIGASASSAANFVIRGEAKLSYTGPAVSTDRNFSLGGSLNGSTYGGGTVSADGTGPLQFTSTDALGADGTGTAVRILNLAGSAPGTSSLAMQITNGIASLTSVVKSGSTTWRLTGNNTYTGDTTINGGTLELGPGTDLANSSFVRINGASSVLKLTDGVTDVVQELWIDGAQAASGTWGASGSGASNIDNARFSGTGKLSVTVGSAANDYNTWSASNSLVEGPAGDDDKDGLTNSNEYAFGLNPKSGSSSNPIVASLNKSAGTFSYTRRDPALNTGLTYSVWTSTDLNTWTLDSTAGQAAGTADGNGTQTVVVTLSNPPTAPNFFVRMKAQ